MRAMLAWLDRELDGLLSMTEEQASWFVRGMALMFAVVVAALIAVPVLAGRAGG